MGKSNRSMIITSDTLISVYVINFSTDSSDATNILPKTTLGSEYYQISYPPHTTHITQTMHDAYIVVATKNNTNLYHNGLLETTLNMGEVYYRSSETDMTGARITANNPVAFFAVNQRALVPAGMSMSGPGSCLIQQLSPVNTWDKTFFVPVTHFPKNIVRIVVSENNTNITQKGGIIRTGVPNAQTALTNLQAGQFVELDIHLDSAGCFIEANHPVGVCAYMTNFSYQVGNNTSYPAQCWIPGINQVVSNIIITPFITNFSNHLDSHHALVVTQTAAIESTKVAIGGATPISLYGGSWKHNAAAGMSFYIMPLTNSSASYHFSNPEGLIIMGYGFNSFSVLTTYYYLAGSAMRKLEAEFYANDIHHQVLINNPFCESLIYFRSEIDGNLHPDQGRIKWYVNGKEEESKRDSLKWSKHFSPDEYEIRMWARFINNDTISKTGTLVVKSCAEFYANNVHYSVLKDTTFCSNYVNFRAEIEELYQSIKWYVDSRDGNGFIEETSAHNLTEWGRTFENGTYEVKMVVTLENGEPVKFIGTLKVNKMWIKIKNVRY